MNEENRLTFINILLQFFEALDLCVEHNINITEELAEKMTPDKNDENENNTTNPDSARVRVLEKVAECCYLQQNYHLATKKFTQAGNRVKYLH